MHLSIKDIKKRNINASGVCYKVNIYPKSK